MEDIAPSLLEAITESFQANIEKNTIIKRVVKRIENGTATTADLNAYSNALGRALSKAVMEHFEKFPNGQMYWNIAEKVIEPLLLKNFDMINDAGTAIQMVLDSTQNIGLKPILLKKPKEKIKGYLEYICEDGIETDQLMKRLSNPLRYEVQKFADEFLYQNAKFRAESGMEIVVTRRLVSKNGCNYCANRAGVFRFSEMSETTGAEVFKRHNGCQCIIEYVNKKAGAR